jgi:hypothetical protein
MGRGFESSRRLQQLCRLFPRGQASWSPCSLREVHGGVLHLGAPPGSRPRRSCAWRGRSPRRSGRSRSRTVDPAAGVGGDLEHRAALPREQRHETTRAQVIRRGAFVRRRLALALDVAAEFDLDGERLPDALAPVVPVVLASGAPSARAISKPLRRPMRKAAARPGTLLPRAPTDPVRRSVMGRPMLRAAEDGPQCGSMRRWRAVAACSSPSRQAPGQVARAVTRDRVGRGRFRGFAGESWAGLDAFVRITVQWLGACT